MPFRYAWIALGVLGSAAGIAIAATMSSSQPAVKPLSGDMFQKGMGRITRPLDSQFPPVSPGAPSPGARARILKLQSIEQTLMRLQKEGIQVDPEYVRLAMDDAPPPKGYVAYAEMPHVVALGRVDAADPMDMAVTCVAAQNGYASTHTIVKTNAAHMVRYRTDLHDWIVSGCAEAIRTRGRVMNGVQFRVAIRERLPDTPEYAELRRELLAELNSRPGSGQIQPPRRAYYRPPSYIPPSRRTSGPRCVQQMAADGSIRTTVCHR